MNGQELYDEGKLHRTKALEKNNLRIYILRAFGLTY